MTAAERKRRVHEFVARLIEWEMEHTTDAYANLANAVGDDSAHRLLGSMAERHWKAAGYGPREGEAVEGS